MADSPQSGDPLAYFTKGQAFQPAAATLNAWQAAARQAAWADPSIGTPGGAGEARILIKNATSTNRARGEVLPPDAPLFLPTTHTHVPTEVPRFVSASGFAHDFDTPAVLLEPIPAGKMGRALLAGTCWAKVNFVTSGDRWAYAKTTPADFTLYSNPATGNARVLWPTSGTGVKDALILLGITPPTLATGTVKTWNTGTHTGTVQITGSTGTVPVELHTYMADLEVDEPVFVLFSIANGKFYILGHPGLEMQDFLLADIDSTTDIVFNQLRIYCQRVGDDSVAHTITTTECP